MAVRKLAIGIHWLQVFETPLRPFCSMVRVLFITMDQTRFCQVIKAYLVVQRILLAFL